MVLSNMSILLGVTDKRLFQDRSVSGHGPPNVPKRAMFKIVTEIIEPIHYFRGSLRFTYILYIINNNFSEVYKCIGT